MIGSDRLRAYLKLHLAEGVGSILFWRLSEFLGGVEAAAAASQGQLRKVQGLGEKTAAAIAGVDEEFIEDELQEAGRNDVEILCHEDPTYPAALKTIANPPPVLYVRGRLEPTDALAVGVVGSRRCTHYGVEQAERFGQLLGRAGFTVVSGGARGIDAAAHRGALAVGGRTVAVMGCGLSTTYPRENAKLFDKIVSDGRGALVSELPMRTAVLSGNFPTRNRIISGFSLGVLIIEAARRSGALITATEAAEQGREVFALPGRVDSSLSYGANRLIREGAILVQDLDDLLEHLGQVGEKMRAEETPQAPPLPAGLTEAENALLEVLSAGPLSLDELVRRTGLESGQVASTMTMLVLKGVLVQRPGNIFARKGAAGA